MFNQVTLLRAMQNKLGLYPKFDAASSDSYGKHANSIPFGDYKDLESACLMHDGYELLCGRFEDLTCLDKSDIDFLGVFMINRFNVDTSRIQVVTLVHALRAMYPEKSMELDLIAHRAESMKDAIVACSSSGNTSHDESEDATSTITGTALEIESVESENYCESDCEEPLKSSGALSNQSSLILSHCFSRVRNPSPLTFVNRVSEYLLFLATNFPSGIYTIDPVNILELPTSALEDISKSTLLSALMSLNGSRSDSRSENVPLSYMTAAVAGVVIKALKYDQKFGIRLISDGKPTASSGQSTRNRHDADNDDVPVITADPIEMTQSEATLLFVAATACAANQSGSGYENRYLCNKLRQVCVDFGLLPKSLFQARRIPQTDDNNNSASSSPMACDLLGSLFDSFCGRVNSIIFPEAWHDSTALVYTKLIQDLEEGRFCNVFHAAAELENCELSACQSSSLSDVDNLEALISGNMVATSIWNVFGPILVSANGFISQSKTAATFCGSFLTCCGDVSMDSSSSSSFTSLKEECVNMFTRMVAASENRFQLTFHATLLFFKTILPSLKRTQIALRMNLIRCTDDATSRLLSNSLWLTGKIEEGIFLALNTLAGVCYVWFTCLATFRLGLYDTCGDVGLLEKIVDQDKKLRLMLDSSLDRVAGVRIDHRYPLGWSEVCKSSVSASLEFGYSMIQQLTDNKHAREVSFVVEFLDECELSIKRLVVCCAAVGRLPFHYDTLESPSMAMVAYERKFQTYVEILRYLLIVSHIQQWLACNYEQSLKIATLTDVIPGGLSIQELSNGKKKHITYFDVLMDLKVVALTIESCVSEGNQRLTNFMTVRWVARLIFMCNDLKSDYGNCRIKLVNGGASVGIDAELKIVQDACLDIIRCLTSSHPYARFLNENYLEKLLK